MSSIINTSEYVLLDNAENATLTPLQRTPCLTPSDCSESPTLVPVVSNRNTNVIPASNTYNASTQSKTSPTTTTPPPQSYESFARELSLHRSNYYLESIVLAKCAGDEKVESISSSKARELLSQLYPRENINSIFHVRLARYLRKHSRVEWASSALGQVDTGMQGKELPGLVAKEDRIRYWYYRALSMLEIGAAAAEGDDTDGSVVEESIKNGMVEAVASGAEEQRKMWVNVGYFLTSVWFILKGDEVDARFWSNLLPVGWTAPDGLYSKHEELFATFAPAIHRVSETNTPIAAGTRDLSQLANLSTQDILVRDVARLKRDLTEVSDVVYMNYKEMGERIKAIHGILDSKDSVGGKDLEELKRRLGYLEGMVLRG